MGETTLCAQRWREHLRNEAGTHKVGRPYSRDLAPVRTGPMSARGPPKGMREARQLRAPMTARGIQRPHQQYYMPSVDQPRPNAQPFGQSYASFAPATAGVEEAQQMLNEPELPPRSFELPPAYAFNGKPFGAPRYGSGPHENLADLIQQRPGPSWKEERNVFDKYLANSQRLGNFLYFPSLQWMP
mmetsp:Transcript_65381/g.108635  ORF Transcript_65381/g.108635 Transcript_65381/m.108635 type:complete len:186 (-) Transcript_65381:149-706(-)